MHGKPARRLAREGKTLDIIKLGLGSARQFDECRLGPDRLTLLLQLFGFFGWRMDGKGDPFAVLGENQGSSESTCLADREFEFLITMSLADDDVTVPFHWCQQVGNPLAVLG